MTIVEYVVLLTLTPMVGVLWILMFVLIDETLFDSHYKRKIQARFKKDKV